MKFYCAIHYIFAVPVLVLFVWFGCLAVWLFLVVYNLDFTSQQELWIRVLLPGEAQTHEVSQDSEILYYCYCYCCYYYYYQFVHIGK